MWVCDRLRQTERQKEKMCVCLSVCLSVCVSVCVACFGDGVRSNLIIKLFFLQPTYSSRYNQHTHTNARARTHKHTHTHQCTSLSGACGLG